jgi:L-serine kinase (ADP)
LVVREIKTAVLLAAGSSRRMGEMCRNTPKHLLEYKNEKILLRTIRQLKANGIEKIILVVGFCKEKMKEAVKDIEGVKIVENDRYKEDVNIYSMHLALKEVHNSFIIVEADLVMEDHLVNYITGTDFEGKSVWFTCGQFNKELYGGILISNQKGDITDIKYVPKFSEEFSSYTKLTGLMRVHKDQLSLFKNLIELYTQKTLQQYYLVPWMENLNKLPCIEGDARHYVFKTFNTPEVFDKIKELDFDPPSISSGIIELVDPNKLKHIEKYDESRVLQLIKKIQNEGLWNMPLYIEKDNNLVLDGQHRLQAALRMGLRRIPVQKFNYSEVGVWSLRKEEFVDIPTVIQRANAGKVYPYKTVKHKFPNVISRCNIELQDLEK